MDIMTSAAFEISLWEIFAASRTANATGLIAGVIGVWVAARFSSVMIDKGANTLGKVLCTAFAVGVFLAGLNIASYITATFDGHAEALVALDVANGAVDLGPGSLAFIEQNASGNPIGMAAGSLIFGVGLLIAVLPLWFNPND
tara:strand:+ start:172 stop:600 length:429 start_codon:yes stop_codon:yes gene_type:complete